MSVVTKHPPLASYYAAAFGAWTNWSEVALHLAFLLPALIVIVATYELARDMTRRPVLAALLTLAVPAFLVSSTSRDERPSHAGAMDVVPTRKSIVEPLDKISATSATGNRCEKGGNPPPFARSDVIHLKAALDEFHTGIAPF
jgi:hypothetical protein